MTEQPPAPSEDLAFALALADLADSISLPRFRAADLRIATKPDRTFVTDADTAVEQALRARIEAEHPDDGFLGEESGRADRGERRWILDPIDGTSNFLRGVPNWGTLIALEVDGEPTVGVVSAPAFGARWWAEIGGGAWGQGVGVQDLSAQDPGTRNLDTRNPDAPSGDGHHSRPRRLRVSGVSTLADASLSFQSIAQWRDAGYLDALLSLSESVWRDRAYGDMWSYMLLAEGLIDLVAEFDVKPYDLAALVPIVREAGGSFTDIAGESTVWTGSSLASNGRVHQAAVEAIATARS